MKRILVAILLFVPIVFAQEAPKAKPSEAPKAKPSEAEVKAKTDKRSSNSRFERI